MLARLSFPRLPVDVLERLMIDGRSLCEPAAEQWQEVFLFLIAYRATRWKHRGQGQFAEWFFSTLPQSHFGRGESRALIDSQKDDEEGLRRKTEEALSEALLESSRLGFWIDLGISSEVKEGALWFEVRHADGVGSQLLTLGAGDEEPKEGISLSLEIRDDREAVVQMFGPMLSASAFGRAVLGVWGRSRMARIEVKLLLPNQAEEELSVGQALVRLASLAEATAPNILLF